MNTCKAGRILVNMVTLELVRKALMGKVLSELAGD